LLFVSQGDTAIGCAISLVYVVFHLVVTARNRWRQELAFIVLFGTAGWLLDGLFVMLHIQTFPSSSFAPIWLLCLWFNYMTSIHYSMVQMFSSVPLTLFVGFIFGPWTYLGCAKLGLVQFSNTWAVCIFQGLVWMVWMWIYRWLVLRKKLA
jgi:Protein of unknown function (DUF2878)